MSFGASDVVPPEPSVKGNGFSELGNLGCRATGEPSAAGDWRKSFHICTAPNVLPVERNVTPKDAKRIKDLNLA